MTEEEAKARLRLLELEGMGNSQSANAAPAPSGAPEEKSLPAQFGDFLTKSEPLNKESFDNPLVRNAAGYAVGVGEGLNPLAIPHNLETLGLAALENQHSDPSLPWYKRAGQALQNAGKQEHFFPSARIEEIAPILRAGVRSAGDLATLNAPNFSEKLSQEQDAQKQFNDLLPENARLAGEITPAIVGLGQVAAKGLKSLGAGDKAEVAANEARVSALGGGKAQVKKLLANDKIQEIGNQLKEDKIMGPFTSRPQIESNIEAAQGNYGQKIGDIVKSADETASGGIVPAQNIIQQAREEVLAPLMSRSTTRAAASKVKDEIDAFEAMHGGGNLSLGELQQFKKDLSDVQKMFARQADNPSVEGYQQLYGVFNKGGENALQSVENSLPPGSGLEDFKVAKKGYGNNTAALKMIADRNARDMTNRMFSPTDYGTGGMMGVGSAAHGDDAAVSLLKGLGGAVVNKGLRQYGNQMKASAWQALADGINGAATSPIDQAFLGKVPVWKHLINKGN